MRGTSLLILLTRAIIGVSPENLTEGKPILERIEWTDIWVTNADRDDLPRVLIVGDSIARGYFNVVESELQDKAYCARFATSMFLTNLSLTR